MNSLKGQRVYWIEEDKGFAGKVVDIEVEDHYFYESNEAIYITVTVEDESTKEWVDVPLEEIRYLGKEGG